MSRLVGSVCRFCFDPTSGQLHLFFVPVDGTVAQLVLFNRVVRITYRDVELELVCPPVVIHRYSHEHFAGYIGATWNAQYAPRSTHFEVEWACANQPRGVRMFTGDGQIYELIRCSEKELKHFLALRKAA